MEDQTKVQQPKKEEQKSFHQETPEAIPGIKTFTPPSKGINPVPVQMKSNSIQVLQQMSDDSKPSYFEPNSLQQIQKKSDPKEPLQKKQVEEEEPLQMKSESSHKMPAVVQKKMESTFGHDFSDVKIHQGDNASSLNALAYTQGSDIHFAQGKYNPESKEGQQLLGHELTHVVQQREGRVQPSIQKKAMNINDDSALEKEADVMGDKVVADSGNYDPLFDSFEEEYRYWLTNMKFAVANFVADFTSVEEDDSDDLQSSFLDFVFNAFGIGDQYSAVLQVVNLLKSGMQQAFEEKKTISFSDFRENASVQLDKLDLRSKEVYNIFLNDCNSRNIKTEDAKRGQIKNFVNQLPQPSEFRKHLTTGWIKTSTTNLFDVDSGSLTAGYVYIDIVYTGPTYPLGIKVGNDRWDLADAFIDDVERPKGTNDALRHAFGENTLLTSLPLDIHVNIRCGTNEGKYINDTFKEVKYERINKQWQLVWGNEQMFKDWLPHNNLTINDLGVD